MKKFLKRTILLPIIIFFNWFEIGHYWLCGYMYDFSMYNWITKIAKWSKL